MQKFQIDSSHQFLNREFMDRHNKNPQFSLRAFARQLCVSPSLLSGLMSGKRQMSLAVAVKFSEHLSLHIETKRALLDAVQAEVKGSTSSRHRPHLRTDESYMELSADVFDVIADWEHFAILNLMKLRDFKPDFVWIARRLGISKLKVQAAVARLVRVNLLKIDARDKWTRPRKSLVTSYNVPSAALRRSHKQTLELAIDSLEAVPVSLRDITAITFPMDLECIPKVQKLTKAFQRKIAKLCQTEKASAVYTLSMQLVPNTKESRQGSHFGEKCH